MDNIFDEIKENFFIPGKIFGDEDGFFGSDDNGKHYQKIHSRYPAQSQCITAFFLFLLSTPFVFFFQAIIETTPKAVIENQKQNAIYLGDSKEISDESSPSINERLTDIKSSPKDEDTYVRYPKVTDEGSTPFNETGLFTLSREEQNNLNILLLLNESAAQSSETP